MDLKTKTPRNILMYSHDTYGLGHIRRTLSIARHLAGEDTNVIILTGSPLAGRFPMPDHVDFVRIPGMIKKTNEDYQPISIRLQPWHAMNIRKSIIMATADTLAPDVFIVDKEPLGLKKEALPALEWMRRELPACRTILGLRDIMDDGETVRADWREKGVYAALEDLYSEVWVYGNQDLHDSVKEYAIPESVARKMVFTGYIPRAAPSPENAARLRASLGAGNGTPLVVVTTGGGGDGGKVVETFLALLEQGPVPYKSVLVTGPFLSQAAREAARERAARLGAVFYEFYSGMEELLAAADLVVSMGGYNTVCELLSLKTPALLVPRETPRREQLLRAEAMSGRGLVSHIRWGDLTPENLEGRISAMLENPEPYRRAMEGFPLTGLDVMKARIARHETGRE
jgi:predicted glycosyltransferase